MLTLGRGSQIVLLLVSSETLGQFLKQAMSSNATYVGLVSRFIIVTIILYCCNKPHRTCTSYLPSFAHLQCVWNGRIPDAFQTHSRRIPDAFQTHSRRGMQPVVLLCNWSGLIYMLVRCKNFNTVLRNIVY